MCKIRRNNNADNAQDKRLVRKIDLWLIPWLCLLYLLSFLGMLMTLPTLESCQRHRSILP